MSGYDQYKGYVATMSEEALDKEVDMLKKKRDRYDPASKTWIAWNKMYVLALRQQMALV